MDISQPGRRPPDPQPSLLGETPVQLFDYQPKSTAAVIPPQTEILPRPNYRQEELSTSQAQPLLNPNVVGTLSKVKLIGINPHNVQNIGLRKLE